MNLDAIPSGSSILLDANILVYASQGLSDQCVRCMQRCAGEDFKAALPAHIAAEFAHQILVEEARAGGLASGVNPVRSLARRPDTVKGLLGHESVFRNLLAGGVEVEPLAKQDLSAMLPIQKQFGFLVNDALLIALGQRRRIQSLASADKAFQNLNGWKVYCPDDL